MSIYNDVVLCDVNNIVDLGEYDKYSEMTEYEKSFLIGLLKQRHPKKILEVGVAAGATTAIISHFMENEKVPSVIYSVDLNCKMWNDSTLDTGFVLKKYMGKFKYVKNELLTGYTVAHWIETIGNNIDFLIIDTTHTLPGEVLDFLTCLHFLAKDAVVVLHDVALNHTIITSLDDISQAQYFTTAYATKVLFTSVYGKKYYMSDVNNPYEISNIAAFEIDNDTFDNIENVISSLTLTWDYIPSVTQWKEYSLVFYKYYDTYLFNEINEIYNLQKRLDAFRYISNHYKGEIRTLFRKWKNCKRIYIYGCGFYGDKYYHFAKENNLPLSGMIVSDGVEIGVQMKEKYDCNIYHISEIDNSDNDVKIIIAVVGNAYDECLNECIKNNMINLL